MLGGKDASQLISPSKKGLDPPAETSSAQDKLLAGCKALGSSERRL